MATSDLLIRQQNGTPKQLVFLHSATFTGAGVDLRDATAGNRVTAECDLTSLASTDTPTTTGIRQSDKIDLGALWAPTYTGRAAIEFAATPVAGQTVECWWAPSALATAGAGNPANVSGTDAAYSGYSSNGGASILQCEFLGLLIVTAQATATVQVMILRGLLRPKLRYGSVLLWNRSGAAVHTGVVNTHIVFDPIIMQAQ